MTEREGTRQSYTVGPRQHAPRTGQVYRTVQGGDITPGSALTVYLEESGAWSCVMRRLPGHPVPCKHERAVEEAEATNPAQASAEGGPKKPANKRAKRAQREP